MELKDLKAYIDGLNNVSTVIPKIQILFEDELSEPTYYISHITEIYDFGTNAELLAKVDEVKGLPSFVGIKKKYIEERLDKNGDVKQEESYRLTVELDFDTRK